jgi:release factor glutamine methyltransferase
LSAILRAPTTATRTIADLRRQIAQTLAATSPSAALDARILIAHVVGCMPNDLALRDESPVTDEAAGRAIALAARRARGEPVARIVGEKEFYGLTLGLGPDTLIPRPDTETLVDAVLETADRNRRLTTLDLGTGSGAILLALLASLPNATGVGVDMSPGAIEVAAANAHRLGLSARAAFIVGDWTQGIAGPFDIVVANPPYIETGEIAGLPVDVRDHDPHVALDGGADGLGAYRVILADLERVLALDGAAYVECGPGQADAVAEIGQGFRFSVRFRRDLAGIERVAILRQKSLC